MSITTIDWINGRVKLIDQTRLPEKLIYLYLNKVEDLWEAIKNLRVRGAPALGIAASLGVVLGIKDSKARTFNFFYQELKKVTKYLATSRPTAVNLFWALRRMEKVALAHKNKTVLALKGILLNEARDIITEDKRICRAIGRNSAGLIKNGDSILTHCNAGGLATADYGTALACIFTAKKDGKRIRVYADETRPLLQGARLTTWELKHAGIDVVLICDSMAGEVMREGKVNKVIVGADRIAANGDTANKIGTYSVAVLAHAHRIPFYIAAPISTIDFS
ncbi:MAG: S-methyl-5-thioribose-1-phosphate isomerase, partial [Candidatus Omnitrophica bacterium]|nr:S-methyl-5-thioribose-1-phosphate isomerase [Candidatus Omnitrophota bacterium]